ncbi:hypothetical protein DPX16_11914 [Anabarilius grahami]|uniref:Uncharacterized protein n=1 Tax=Anabarilius grahami TaxID=495550 RepID=A0A3N0YCE8_ANAGA|nr:hypothetical protein DPX16_11914 [Anabarilius grahami]
MATLTPLSVTAHPTPSPLTPCPSVTQCLLTRPLSSLLITFRIPCACGVLAMCTLYLSSHSLFHMASALSSSCTDRVSSTQSSDRHEALEAVTEYTKTPFHPPLSSTALATTHSCAKRRSAPV